MKTKKIITTSLILISITLFISCASTLVTIPTPEPEVKNIENNSDKNSNFIKANEWMVQTFNNAKSCIQFKDKEAGLVKGRYVMREGYTSPSGYSVSTATHFSVITLRVKDKLVRIETEAPTGMYTQKVMGVEYGFTKEMFIEKANELIADFEVYMKMESTNDSW
jgi:hypothetical protein